MFLSRTDSIDTSEKAKLILLSPSNTGHAEPGQARSANLDALQWGIQE